MEEQVKVKSEDQALKARNTEEYSKVKEKKQEVVTVSMEKAKIIQTKIFANGVQKRKVVGIVKNGYIINNKGIDPDILKKYKVKK